MRIVVIGGTGLIGSKVVRNLTDHGHEAVAASPDSGVNTLTGEGLREVLQGADVVVGVSASGQRSRQAGGPERQRVPPERRAARVGSIERKQGLQRPRPCEERRRTATP